MTQSAEWIKASASGNNGCVELAAWRKSSFSGGNGGNCVEVAAGDGVQVRDSKLGDRSPVLRFTHAEWAAFVNGVQAGEFDHG